MMPVATEVASSLYGSYRLLLGDARGAAFYDDSTEGFWRSFSAALIAAPPYILSLWHDQTVAMVQPDPTRLFLVIVIGYIIAWTAFPVAVLTIVGEDAAQLRNFRRLVVALNWSYLIQVIVTMPIAMLHITGGVDQNLLASLGLAATMALLVYQWFVCKVTFETTSFVAASLTGLSFLISSVVVVTQAAMLQV